MSPERTQANSWSCYQSGPAELGMIHLLTFLMGFAQCLVAGSQMILCFIVLSPSCFLFKTFCFWRRCLAAVSSSCMDICRVCLTSPPDWVRQACRQSQRSRGSKSTYSKRVVCQLSEIIIEIFHECRQSSFILANTRLNTNS